MEMALVVGFLIASKKVGARDFMKMLVIMLNEKAAKCEVTFAKPS